MARGRPSPPSTAAAEVRRPATLLDLLAEVAAAGQFVGNDSGPAHLAGILGVPTLSLFGPTDPAPLAAAGAGRRSYASRAVGQPAPSTRCSRPTRLSLRTDSDRKISHGYRPLDFG